MVVAQSVKKQSEIKNYFSDVVMERWKERWNDAQGSGLSSMSDLIKILRRSVTGAGIDIYTDNACIMHHAPCHVSFTFVNSNRVVMLFFMSNLIL